MQKECRKNRQKDTKMMGKERNDEVKMGRNWKTGVGCEIYEINEIKELTPVI